jgi:hypothetical protein
MACDSYNSELRCTFDALKMMKYPHHDTLLAERLYIDNADMNAQLTTNYSVNIWPQLKTVVNSITGEVYNCSMGVCKKFLPPTIPSTLSTEVTDNGEIYRVIVKNEDENFIMSMVVVLFMGCVLLVLWLIWAERQRKIIMRRRRIREYCTNSNATSLVTLTEDAEITDLLTGDSSVYPASTPYSSHQNPVSLELMTLSPIAASQSSTSHWSSVSPLESTQNSSLFQTTSFSTPLSSPAGSRLSQSGSVSQQNHTSALSNSGSTTEEITLGSSYERQQRLLPPPQRNISDPLTGSATETMDSEDISTTF